MYKTREKYYIIIMNFKNDKEYIAALKNFVKLRNDKNTPVLTLAEMYDSFVKEEYNRMQDSVLNSWLDGLIIDDVFSDLFLNEYELESKAIIFLDEKMLTHVEKIVNSEIQSEE